MDIGTASTEIELELLSRRYAAALMYIRYLDRYQFRGSDGVRRILHRTVTVEALEDR